VDRNRRTIWIIHAHRRDDGKRYVAQADEKLTAFLELERVTRESLLPKWRITRHNSSMTSLLSGEQEATRPSDIKHVNRGDEVALRKI
jgi:hypothetical protein